jgi:Delta7-sterol 5-desaturase
MTTVIQIDGILNMRIRQKDVVNITVTCSIVNIICIVLYLQLNGGGGASLASYAQIAFNESKSALFQYLIPGALLYGVFWIVLKKTLGHKKIQKVWPDRQDLFREIIISFYNIVTIGALSVLILLIASSEYSRLYPQFGQRGVLYEVFAFLAYAIALDSYYYWVHRLLHHPRFYRRIHLIHHLSKAPTPWATFAIAPLEQFIVAVFYMGIICLVPISIPMFTAFVLIGLIRQFIGHLGFEVFPRSCVDGWLGWSLTVTHHDMHHKHITCNYGLYFSFWDWLMGTNHADYKPTFSNLFKSR